MNESDKETIIFEKKAKYFLEKKSPVHCRLKTGTFYNGEITYVGHDFIMIKDRKIGDTPVFYIEINRIEPFSIDVGNYRR